MFIRVTDVQGKAILGSMLDIALAHGDQGVTDADARTIDAAAMCMMRKNAETFPRPDPGTFGHAFWQHFKRNHFPFPGNPNGLAEVSPPLTTPRT